ncbi:MAG: glycosyltransferase family 2 protein [Bacteroidales bacterium]|nr:glycosyltransferase family 2 protein [Bacteroidales bacterium]
MIKVSVIIPVYGVERFIVRCARNLFGQTLEDVEFIFVDDASPDGSIALLEDILKEFPARTGQTRILRHPVNKGLPAARNTGLAAASGEYIYHCDSDDWTETTMLEKMYDAAKEADADIVYCDFFLSFEKNERYMSNPDYTSAEEMLRKGFLGGRMKYNVWNKLAKRSLYTDNGISFPEGHPMGEDMTMIQVAACSTRVIHVPEALYHYVKLNEGAYSNSYSQKKLDDIRFNVDRTVTFLEGRFGESIERDLAFFKLSIKLPFLLTGDRNMYDIWKEWYPEADRYAGDSKELPFRTRLLQTMARYGQWWYVKAYYTIIYKVIYGIIYR